MERSRGLATLAIVALATLSCPAQPVLDLAVAPLISGELGSAQTSGGTPGAPVWYAMDAAAGTRTIPGTTITVHLAMTPLFYVFPMQFLDTDGNHTLTVPVTSNPLAVGAPAFVQAMTIDPTHLIAGANVSDVVHSGIHPPTASGGQTTTLGLDDDEVHPFLMQAMTFPFYGTSYGTVHIASNGRLSFNGGDPLSIENTVEFLGEEPSIAVLWDDLDPSSGGSVDVTEDPSGEFVRISWTAVPQYGFLDASTAHCTLHASGAITLEYETVTVQDGLVGISPGNNLSLAGAADLSQLCWHATTTGSAVYEIFWGTSPSLFDLSHSMVSLVPLAPSKYTILHQ